MRRSWAVQLIVLFVRLLPPVDAAMTHRVHKAKTSDQLEDVLKIMSTHQVRRVPVVNETGRLTGIVALADVARQSEIPQNLGKTVEKISLEPGDR